MCHFIVRSRLPSAFNLNAVVVLDFFRGRACLINISIVSVNEMSLLGLQRENQDKT